MLNSIKYIYKIKITISASNKEISKNACLDIYTAPRLTL